MTVTNREIEIELIVLTLKGNVLATAVLPAENSLYTLPYYSWELLSNLEASACRLADHVAPGRRINPQHLTNSSRTTTSSAFMNVTYWLACSETELNYKAGYEAVPLSKSTKLPDPQAERLFQAKLRARSMSIFAPVAPILLGDSFSLSQVQDVTEALRQSSLDKRHLRRSLLESGWLEETGELTGGAHRPAKLYRISKAVELDSFFPLLPA